MAELTLMKNAAEQQLAAEWAAAKARLPGVAPLREAAFERFAAAGLPHRRVEEWKYTDLRALMRDAKPLAGAPDRSEEHTSELQSLTNLVCRLLLEKKKKQKRVATTAPDTTRNKAKAAT